MNFFLLASLLMSFPVFPRSHQGPTFRFSVFLGFHQGPSFPIFLGSNLQGGPESWFFYLPRVSLQYWFLFFWFLQGPTRVLVSIFFYNPFRVPLGSQIPVFRFFPGCGFLVFQDPTRVSSPGFLVFLRFHQGLTSWFFCFSRLLLESRFLVVLVFLGSHQGPGSQFSSMP